MSTRETGFSRVGLLLVLAVVFALAGMGLSKLDRARVRAARISCVGNGKHVGLAFRIWSNDHEEQFPWARHQKDGGCVPNSSAVGEAFGEIVDAFRCLSNELTVPKVLVCPDDPVRIKSASFDPQAPAPFGGKPPAVETKNLSYVAGWDADETRAQGVLSGDSHFGELLPSGLGDAGRSGLNRSVSRLRREDAIQETNVTWTSERHRGIGILGLADGSSHQVAPTQLPEFLLASVLTHSNEVFRIVFPKR
ncbi:MAG: hypothetical protein JNN07_20175 [Verrucomicrobiales bacterium]|nr:hypothetical protein [Verrucomicrobiales bacterium]